MWLGILSHLLVVMLVAAGSDGSLGDPLVDTKLLMPYLAFGHPQVVLVVKHHGPGVVERIHFKVIMAVGQAGSSAWHLGASRLLPPIVVVGQPSSYPVGPCGPGSSTSASVHMAWRHCLVCRSGHRVVSGAGGLCAVVLSVWSCGHVWCGGGGRRVFSCACVCVPVKPTRNHYRVVVTRGCTTYTLDPTIVL